MVTSTQLRLLSVIVSVGLISACSGTETVEPGPDLDTPFASISVGILHTCGLTTGGEAYCWGEDNAGQLGAGWQGNSSVPVLVAGQP